MLSLLISVPGSAKGLWLFALLPCPFGSLLLGFACGQAENTGVSTFSAGSPQVLPGKVGVALSSHLQKNSHRKITFPAPIGKGWHGGRGGLSEVPGARASRFKCVPCLVAQLCWTPCDPMAYSPPGSSVHGDSPDKNTGVDCHAFLQGIFPARGSNLGFLHCRPIPLGLSHQGLNSFQVIWQARAPPCGSEWNASG